MTIHFSLQDFNQHTKLGSIDSQQLHQYLAQSNTIQSVMLGQHNSVYCRVTSTAPPAMNEINTQLGQVSKTGRIFYADQANDGQIQIKARFPKQASTITEPFSERQYNLDHEPHQSHPVVSSNTPATAPAETQPISIKHEIEFPQATTQELASQGQLTEIKPGLLTGHLITDDGRCVYMARQKSFSKETDADNYIGALGTYFKQSMVAISLYEKPETAFHKDIKVEDYLVHLQLKSTSSKRSTHYNTLKQAKYAITGEMLTSDDFRHAKYFYDKKHVYYVSTQPITEVNFKQDMSFKTLRDFHTNAGHIAMVITSASNKDRTILRGICKTPSAIFNNLKATFNRNNQNIGLAVALQHFGIACSKHDGLKYSTFSPMPHMTSIFQKQLQTDNTNGLFVGRETVSEKGLQAQLGPTKDNETPIVINNEEYQNPLWP